MKIPTTLIIMDGYGLSAASSSNAITCAETPNLTSFFRNYPKTMLSASGEDVGLPAGQIGNSEVGHTNIGAGRVVYQDLSRISREIKNGMFFENPVYTTAMDSCASSGSSLHLMGLVSPGGVHSHTDHLWAFIEMAKRHHVKNLYIHCFMDGRDTPPASGINSIRLCLEKCREAGVGKIATIMGRFYAMDRDKRWDRIETAYNALVCGDGISDPDPVHAMQASYDAGITDEFIKPVICENDGLIRPQDTIIFINFRPDRAREITRAFVDPSFEGFVRKHGFFHVNYICTTQYDATIANVSVAYPPEELTDTFGETVSHAGLTQLRIAETEKYAHVTFFFNGGNERVYDGEDRILIDSPRDFPTYDLIPEMSAYKVASEACVQIKSGKYDVIILNFANCDMVGHTGVLDATIKAVHTVDECVGMVVEATSEMGGISVITADHGNAEQMLDSDGTTPHTAHTTNPVPFVIVGADISLRSGRLCDIAPTLLDIMGLEKPTAMTGSSLIIS